MEQVRLLKGDNRELLKTLETNSIDSVVSDPPYGLSFMNKKWDYDVPSVELWKEVLRVLKPGGHVLSFGGTRTYHRMVVNMEDAGFEIRDSISYMYGSGFPKSHNIGKAVDKLNGNERTQTEYIAPDGKKRNGVLTGDEYYKTEGDTYNNDVRYKTKGNSEWEGWGTALKPSMELICLARKPLSEKSIAENVLKHGTGGINIDDCRVEYENTPNPATNPKYRKENGYKLPEPGQESNGAVQFTSSKNEINTEGRFPANTILECICDEVIPGENKGLKKETFENYGNGELGKKDGRKTQPTPKEIEGTWYKDTGDIHTNPECPCYILDKQSGVSITGASKPKQKYSGGNLGGGNAIKDYPSSKGGASRFFYTAKVSKKERNMGLDNIEKEVEVKFVKGGLKCENCNKWKNSGNPCICNEPNFVEQPFNSTPNKNSHPTVKPINLMTYLCRLITPPNGVILDMYMGSGSTGISALLEGFKFVGMEMDDDYFNIAEARINNYEQYRQFKK